jgi:hypothetical protein
MKTEIWWYTPHNHQNDRSLKMAMIFNHVLEILFPSPRNAVLQDVSDQWVGKDSMLELPGVTGALRTLTKKLRHITRQ